MSADGALGLPVHHLGYVVEDIPTAVAEWGSLGVGPFFLLEHVTYEVQSHRGEPCVLDHTAAFGHTGEVGLELHQIHLAEPARLGQELGLGRGSGVNHVAYVLEDPAAESRRLAAKGWPQTFYGAAGPIRDYMHYVPALGHVIELHIASEPFAAAWAGFAAAARDWDGTEPLREMRPPE